MKRLFAVILAISVCLIAEALAQGPNDLNSGSQLSLGNSSGVYNFSWWGVGGYTYLMETSDDLIHWSYIPEVEYGYDSAIQWGFYSDASKLFMKLEYITVPASAVPGTTFKGPDNNGNGLPDDWELFYYGYLGVNPNAFVSWSAGLVTNLQAYQQGLSPLSAANFMNLSVSLPIGVTNVALTWSGYTTTETGYVILRKSGTSDFQPIAKVGANANTYNDYTVQGSTTYTYEVAALNGAGQSAPSNQASATTLLDSNGDGVPDVYKWMYGIDPADGTNSVGGSGLPDGWLIEYGLNPFSVTDAGVDLIGKGWSLGDDYANGTNPNMVDTDGDGVPDTQDDYPLDPDRSHDILANPIAMLDLSGTNATADVSNVALDDQDNASFAFYTGEDSFGFPADLQVYNWQNGAATFDQDVSLVEDMHTIRTPMFLQSSGQVYGMDGPYQGHGFTTAFESHAGYIDDLFPPEPPYLSGSTGTATTELFASSDSGIYDGQFGGIIASGTNSDSGSAMTIVYSGSSVVFSHTMAVTKVTLPSNMRVVDADFVPRSANNNGHAIGYAQWSPNFQWLYWDGQQVTDLPGTPSHLNDQGQVIGTDNNGNGYLWSSGTMTSIQSLVPAVYQNQLQNISASFISNQDPNDGTTRIIFDAQSLEGPNPGQWALRTFELQTSGTASSSGSNATLTEIRIPEAASINFSAFNSSGVGAGIGVADETTTSQQAYMTFPIHFDPAELSDYLDIQKGFDPPKSDDKYNGQYVDLTNPSDPNSDVKPEWWTSVGGSGTLSTNNFVKIVFPSDSVAKVCHLTVTAGSSAISSVTDASGNDLLGDSSRFASKETVLTIKGTNTTTNPVSATLQVAGLSGTSVPTLHVDVMPVRNISLGIYYVTDTNSIGTPSVPGTELPYGVPDSGTIVSNLNRIYQQAAVTFTADVSSATTTIPYDVNRDGYLQDLSTSSNNSECSILNTVAKAKLNVVIVGKLAYNGTKSAANVGGIYPGSGNIVYVFAQKLAEGNPLHVVDTNIFYNAIAHEIGHALTLSTRTDPNLADGFSEAGAPLNHDPGKFPRVTSPETGISRMSGLMYWHLNEFYWMRHADWEKANQQAPVYQ